VYDNELALTKLRDFKSPQERLSDDLRNRTLIVSPKHIHVMSALKKKSPPERKETQLLENRVLTAARLEVEQVSPEASQTPLHSNKGVAPELMLTENTELREGETTVRNADRTLGYGPVDRVHIGQKRDSQLSRTTLEPPFPLVIQGEFTG
jgi:hypothetical protein